MEIYVCKNYSLKYNAIFCLMSISTKKEGEYSVINL